MVKKALLGQLSDTDVRLLRIFRAVVECGGFAAAELELNINRSTISRHIHALETRLGATLCRRGRSGFSLTPDGRHIYESALRLLAAIDEFRADVNDIHQRLTGSLTLAFFDKTVSNPNAHCARALREFDQIAPDVRIEIFIEPLNEIERGVMEGRFQLGIIPGHRTSSSLTYFPLFDEQMYLYCSREHPLYAVRDQQITRQQVLSHKYAGLGYHSPNMEVGRTLNMERSATAYDQEAIAQLICSGRYLGYLPDHYASTFVAQGLMRAVRADVFQYRCEFSAITRHSPAPSRLVKSFLDTLLAVHKR